MKGLGDMMAERHRGPVGVDAAVGNENGCHEIRSIIQLKRC